VIDDRHSIAKFSRYATLSLNAPNIRKERETVDFLREIAERYNLKGWVLFPTRDEHVAAVSRWREELAQWYRVPTPGWDCIKWAWNKRNTYKLAERLGIPTPRTWCPRNQEELDAIAADFPLAVKPAVKEDFFMRPRRKPGGPTVGRSYKRSFARRRNMWPAMKF